MDNHIITINRMYGSNGRIIGQALARDLNFKFYDKELVQKISQEKHIPLDDLSRVDEKKANQWRFPVESELQMSPEFHFIPMNDVVFKIQKEMIEKASQKENCIIVGRCANHILKNCNVLRVFIYSPFEERVKVVMKRTCQEEKNVRRLVKRMDKERRAYYEYFTDCRWTNLEQYDLCIDSSKFSKEQIVSIIKSAIK